MNKGKRYHIQKVLSNNAVLVVDEQDNEMILLGKGIGFQKKKGDLLPHDEQVEKVFVLSSGHNRDILLRLFSETDDALIRAASEYIQYVEAKLDKALSEQFVVAFIDHLSFAVKRLRQGIMIPNPFLHEVRSLYPLEYSLAQEGIKMLEDRLHMEIPQDEIGFIALHLHGARTNQSLTKMNRFSELINKLVQVIEEELEITIDKTSTDYSRLVTHLRFAVERAEKGQPLGDNHPLSILLQREYPVCYNLSWKLIKIMRKELKTDIPETEASYLTLHIHRLRNHLN